MRSTPQHRSSQLDSSDKAAACLSQQLLVGAFGVVKQFFKDDGSEGAAVAVKGVGFRHTSVAPLPDGRSAVVCAGINLRRYALDSATLLWENRLGGMGTGCASLLVVPPGLETSASHLRPTFGLPSYEANKETTGSNNGSSSNGASECSPHDRVFVACVGHVHCARISDGVTLWKHDPGVGRRFKLPRLLADSDGRVFVAGQGRVRCLSAETGAEIWNSTEIPFAYANLATLAVGNGETNRSSPFDILLARQESDDAAQRRDPSRLVALAVTLTRRAVGG
ncbi:hypothetical protein HK405_001825 [Cladochytrium tenue]|nr:hypothetical protein HK405_001825 [Cladochytrium tenue]